LEGSLEAFGQLRRETDFSFLSPFGLGTELLLEAGVVAVVNLQLQFFLFQVGVFEVDH